MILKNKGRYRPEVKQFIVDHNHGVPAKDLAGMVNERFGTDEMTAEKIKLFRNNNDLNSGLTGRFEKGHVPRNKGTKGLTKANSGSFKKGNVPANKKPVGSERYVKDYYVEVKVADPNVWIAKSVYVLQQAGIEVPKGAIVKFIDGNKFNFALDNLRIITKQEMLKFNQNKYGQITDKELANVALNKVKVDCLIREHKRRKK